MRAPMVYWAAVAPPNSTNSAIGPTPASHSDEWSTRRPVDQAWRATPTISISADSVCNPRRKKARAAEALKLQFAERSAADRRQREIGRVGHCHMRTPPRKNSPFPRLLLGLSREYPTTPVARSLSGRRRMASVRTKAASQHRVAAPRDGSKLALVIELAARRWRDHRRFDSVCRMAATHTTRAALKVAQVFARMPSHLSRSPSPRNGSSTSILLKNSQIEQMRKSRSRAHSVV